MACRDINSHSRSLAPAGTSSVPYTLLEYDQWLSEPPSALAASIGKTDSRFDSRRNLLARRAFPTGARATDSGWRLRRSPTRRSRCRPRRRRPGDRSAHGSPRPGRPLNSRQQLGQAPAASPQPSLERLAIRVVRRPRIHAGNPPVLRHHRRVVARHRRLAAAADRQAVGTQAVRLHQDVHPLGSDPVNNRNSQYWFTDDWDTPLKAWAEARAGDSPYD